MAAAESGVYGTYAPPGGDGNAACATCLLILPDNPLQSLANYSRFMAETLNRPTVVRSTVVVWPASPYTGMAEGEVVFVHGLRLRMREELDFAAGLIASYGYEVYRGDERL